MGITFSLAIDWRILGGPYRLPIQEDTEDIYRPANHSTPAIETYKTKYHTLYREQPTIAHQLLRPTNKV